MTTSEMIEETRATMAYDQDPVRPMGTDGNLVAVSDARIVMYLNRALERLGDLCRVRANVTLTTIAGVGRYDLRGSALSRRVSRVLKVGTGSPGFYWLSQGPEMLGGAPGTPCRFQTFEREIALSPAPSTIATYTLDAYVLPTLLDVALPNAVCDLPDTLHLEACRWAAAEMPRPWATESQQRARLADEKTLAEQEAVRIGRASIVATSGAPVHRGRFV